VERFWVGSLALHNKTVTSSDRSSDLRFRKPASRWAAAVILLIAALLACLISICAPIRIYTGMDPRGSSLVAQALIQKHTPRVDGYRLPPSQWLFEQIHGHTYSTYPLGTPILIIPVVAAVLPFGGDMQNDKDDLILQKGIAPLTVCAFMILGYLILRCFLEPVNSATLAAVWTLGSGVISTMGAALWSINFGVLFESLVVLILVRNETGHSKRLRPVLIGSALFCGFLCRPSAALLAIPTAILLWMRSKKAAVSMAATFGILLFGLCVYSINEFGTWLPEYYFEYSAVHSPGVERWFKALYGLTFGPARGLFVFQPFLIAVALGALFYLNQLWRISLFWLAVSWIILDILMVSRWPVWWGGGSFGSRLLVESFPGWVLLTGMIFAVAATNKKQHLILVSCFGLLVTVGIFINSYQGLYNWSTWEWNTLQKSQGADPKNVYDWRFPQAFANPAMIAEMKKEDDR
jgi:hypothetical protein